MKPDLSNLSSEAPIDIVELRARLRKMSDDELRRWGRAALYMTTPKANLGGPPKEVFLIQLAEARAEWERRKKPRKPAAEKTTSKKV